MVLNYSSNTQEIEAEDQPGQHSETLSQERKTKVFKFCLAVLPRRVTVSPKGGISHIPISDHHCYQL